MVYKEFLIVVAILSLVLSEMLDMTTVYRFHELQTPVGDVKASVEVSMRTNAVGRLFTVSSYNTFLDQQLGMPHLGCVYAASKCEWKQDGNWVTKDDIIDLSQYIIQHDETVHYSYEENKDQICKLCDDNLRYRTHVAQLMHQGNIRLLTQLIGVLKSPDYPNNYPNYLDESWLINTPGATISLIFTSFSTEACCDIVEVYDGYNTSSLKLGRFSGNDIPPTLKSTHNVMLVTFHTDGGSSSSGFSAGYTAEFKKVVSLSDGSGFLTSPSIQPTSPGLCVSLIYMEPSSETSLWVSAEMTNGRSINLTGEYKQLDIKYPRERGIWYNAHFRSSLTAEDMRQSLILSAHFRSSSSVFSISGCNPYGHEDVYFLYDSVLVKRSDDNQVENNLCYSGGVMIENSTQCQCQPGFTGNYCEEGCGPNSYGYDCGGTCSDFEKGCQEMKLCVPNLPCLCATGFEGRLCDIFCPSRYYGANCSNRCGHCVNDATCDIYTGRCPDLCSPGYYPPLCQHTYQHFLEAPEVEYTDLEIATITVNLSNVIGRGNPEFFQVQYMESNSEDWVEVHPENINGEMVRTNITVLHSGVHYRVRVILIDTDGNSYQHDDVPTVDLELKCIVPTSDEYHLESEYITPSSFDVSWKYDIKSPLCPITGYDVILQHRWRQQYRNTSSKDLQIEFSGLLSGQQYEMRVRAVTEHGKAPFSSIFPVITTDKAPGEVSRLESMRGEKGELHVSWEKPIFSGGTIRSYSVDYQCLRYLACDESCYQSSGVLDVTATSVVLSHLLPHAQYNIKVAGEAATTGPYRAITAATSHAGATIPPLASPVPILRCSNTSFTVQWLPPSDCTQLNGFEHGYRFELVANSTLGQHIIQSGTIKDTQANFTNLTPHTMYQVQVYVLTSGGWNSEYKLVIPVTTNATSPEAVQDLAVYKRDRRSLGVRWAPPLNSYGLLKSFIVTYHPDKDASKKIRVIIDPKHCTAWPRLYCHTIYKLQPTTKYEVHIQARNSEVDVDGSTATILAITHESAPEAPSVLRVLDSNQTSLLIEWGPPNMYNGILRSFLINVDHTDSANSFDCCESFPIHELGVVQEDQQIYQFEITGLKPASSLIVSVSAKTVTLGSSINVTAYTPPDSPTLQYPPEILSNETENGILHVILQADTEYSDLSSTYLVLVLPHEEIAEPVIWDKKLLNLLSTAINQTFYMIEEYNSEDLLHGKETTAGTGNEARNGTLGHLQDPVLSSGTYRIGLALILDYNGAKSVGFVASEPFMVS